MTTSNTPCEKAGLSAFTLIELLLVILVLTILYGMSLTAIRAVARHTHKTATRAELKSIETAWKQYYAHYQRWPTNGTAGVLEPMPIAKELADALQGLEEDGPGVINPDKIVFMEFARLDEDEKPLNVWGTSGRFEHFPCLYYVAFDDDYDNRVVFPTNNPPDWNALRTFSRKTSASDDGTSSSRREIPRGVIVWTFDPELKEDDPDYLIGSWQE